MAFKGTLKDFKVPDILQLISLQKKTGILTFTSGDGAITLIFKTGMIVGVDSFPKKIQMHVGSVLVKQDYISEEMLQRALDIQKRTNQRIGEILVGMGLIDRDKVTASLKTQAIEIALSLFKWKMGEYNFKVMDELDEGMEMIEPVQTDNLILEGVQMMDEWPHIKRVISEPEMIFEPAPVDSRNIEIVSEYDEIPEVEGDKIYLTENDTNLLKHVNGKNTVQDLVDMGVFTEYKVYKGLFNLVKKKIIRVKILTGPRENRENEALLEIQQEITHKMDKLFKVFIVILLALLLFSIVWPLHPFKGDNILFKKSLYETFFSRGK